MQDITCAKCGEPWSLYAMRHDVANWPDEPDDAAERFQHGEGCPVCDWGDKAGDVSRSRSEDAADLEAEHKRGLLRNTDEDPIKYL